MAAFKSATVIRSRRYHKKGTDRYASIYGACPWTGAPGNTADDWEIVQSGYSLSCIDHRGVQTIRGPQYAPYRLDTIDEALAFGHRIANTVDVGIIT
jgi:hypothetical protein